MNKLNNPDVVRRVLLDRMFFHLDYLKYESGLISDFEDSIKNLDVPIYYFKNLLKNSYDGNGLWNLNFSDMDDPRAVYLSRILGHKIDSKKFFKYPKFCVLYSLCILKERWKQAENFIVSDEIAAYLYSKYVICGKLPEKMHNQIVLNSFISKSKAIQEYFLKIGTLQEQKLCYN